MKEKPIEPVHKTRLYLSDGQFRILLASASLVLIVVFTWLAALRTDRELRENLLQQAQMVAATVDSKQVVALSGNAADLSSPGYRRIKEQLTRIRRSNHDCRFLYIMSRRADGTIIINVDSEPIDSKDYSPPGQVYKEAPGKLYDVFHTGRAIAKGPYNDRWGSWISAFVPLPDPTNRGILTVFGMDIAAKDWIWTVALQAVLPAALIAVAVMLGLIALLLHRSRRNINAHRELLRESEEKFRVLSEKSMAGVYLIQDETFKYVNHKIIDLLGYSEDEIVSKAIRDFIMPEDLPMFKEHYQKRISGEVDSLRYELRMINSTFAGEKYL
jgi:PAS domain S-box-containing protein